MSAGHRYRTQAALRTAVEEHLRQRAHDTGVPLDRLRKEVAHQRLGSQARTTKDVNAVPDDQRSLEHVRGPRSGGHRSRKIGRLERFAEQAPSERGGVADGPGRVIA